MKGWPLFVLSAFALLLAPGCQQQPTNSDPSHISTVTPEPEVVEPEPPPPPRYPKPEIVRGMYMTAWVAGSTNRRAQLFELIGDTELNAVVIDIRDVGANYWETNIELDELALATELAVVKPEELMDLLDEYDIYPIARISCFVDNYVPDYDVARAVQRADGTVWRERSGRRWLDPYNKTNWEYLGEIVDFAVEQGFPEIQLDYVRFPAGGLRSSMVFPAKDEWPEETTDAQVIQEFAQFIRDRLPEDVVLSADIFGIVSSTTKDQGIGQDMEYFPQPFDLLCPMVYPNHYANGEYGIADPNGSPYEILMKSVGDFVELLPDKPLRPWLQTFGGYGVDEVREQIRALKELGVQEYLLWHSGNSYEGRVPVDTSDLDPEPLEEEPLSSDAEVPDPN
ncbi:MAG: hypothetical protein IH944_07145 [Armatimonadetes bacterium]|nr:hypothetical protein [Armatimonadota bacterium]